MSQVTKKRTRQQRVATVELPPGFWGNLGHQLQRGSVLLRLALCALVAIVLLVITQGWDPPFRYRLHDIPERDVVASVNFEQLDQEATKEARTRARRLTVAVYDQDPAPLEQLRAELRLEIAKLLAAETFPEVDEQLWRIFSTPAGRGNARHDPRGTSGTVSAFSRELRL